MAETKTFDMKPVEVPQEILDGFKTIPTATVYSAVRQFGSPVCVCEGLQRYTAGGRIAGNGPRRELQITFVFALLAPGPLLRRQEALAARPRQPRLAVEQGGAGGDGSGQRRAP